MSDSAYPCPTCGHPTVYQSFSAGTEGYCEVCDSTFKYPATGDNLPRATMMRSQEGMAVLKAVMDEEMERRKVEREELSLLTDEIVKANTKEIE